MGPTSISTRFLLTSLAGVVLLELAATVGVRMQLPPLWLTAATRTVQILAVLSLAVYQTGGLQVFGLHKKAIIAGSIKGLVWSAVFALVTGLAFFVLVMAGHNPLILIRSPLPHGSNQLAQYFVVGGIVAPLAEEILFRGLIFGYLRRWGLPVALILSTALFAAFHLSQLGPTLPITQIVGGIVFALAYHAGKSLMVPVVIHALGNLAIFTLSLPLFH